MLKYHIADILTAIRFVCVFALLYLVLSGINTLMADWQRWLAFLLFGIGELTDAFDGMAARRWRYPDDGKKRWWRTHAVVLDQVADILLGVAALAYVTLFCSFVIGTSILVLGAIISIPVQLWRQYRIRKFGADESQDPLRVRVILVRRYLYLVAIGVVTFTMVATLPMPATLRGVIVVVLIAVVVGLMLLKQDRLHEDKTK